MRNRCVCICVFVHAVCGVPVSRCVCVHACVCVRVIFVCAPSLSYCRDWMTYWRVYIDELHGAYRASGGSAPFIPTLIIRYEDLCANPMGVLREVAATAGMQTRTDGAAVEVCGCVAV